MIHRELQPEFPNKPGQTRLGFGSHFHFRLVPPDYRLPCHDLRDCFFCQKSQLSRAGKSHCRFGSVDHFPVPDHHQLHRRRNHSSDERAGNVRDMALFAAFIQQPDQQPFLGVRSVFGLLDDGTLRAVHYFVGHFDAAFRGQAVQKDAIRFRRCQ